MEHLTDAIGELTAATLAANGDPLGTPNTWFEAVQLRVTQEYVGDLVDDTFDRDQIDEHWSEAYAEGHSEGRDTERMDLTQDFERRYAPLLIAARDILDALANYAPGRVAPEATQLATALAQAS